jgi:hypothetical protein|tara:strand:- start:126 stop:1976 length:1851 start_codon:yes stop_codon:yes gene_type:complete
MANLTIANNDARVQYTTNSDGSAGAFTIDFPFFSLDDIKVIVTIAGTDTTRARVASSPNSVQFTVSGTAADDEGFTGGSVTLGAAVASAVVTIFRDIVIERSTDFPTSGAFNIGSLNTDLDKTFAIAQENNTKYDRSIRLAESDTDVTMLLPNAATRAGKGLVFDSSGNTLSAIVYPASASATVSTVNAGGNATASASYNTTTGAIAFALGVPTGATGAQGSTGNAATIAINSVSKLSPGATPTVANAGNSAAANLNFGIPSTQIWSTGTSFPGSPSDQDLFVFTSAVANGLTWKDTNGSTALTSAAKGDVAKYQTSGTKWVKQTNIVGATGSTGSQGAQGAQGQTGAAGQDGADGDGTGDMNDVIDDTTPQLGGNLDMNSKDIITTSNANIDLAPHGTGKVVIRGNTNSGILILNCENNTHGQQIKGQPHSANISNELTLPAGGNGELVSTVATQTLTNKSIVATQLTGTVDLARLSDASTSAKGIASFASADFAVSSGAVTLEAAVPKTDETNVYTAPQRNALTADNDGSLDMNANNNFKITAGGNFALTFTNHADGQSGYVLLVNSGGHTISLHANTKGSATTAATLTTAGTYLVSYLSDGTNAYITNSVVYA